MGTKIKGKCGIRKEIKMIGSLICMGIAVINLVLINWVSIPISGGLIQIIGALICTFCGGFCLGISRK